jgi:hypothetical protein
MRTRRRPARRGGPAAPRPRCRTATRSAGQLRQVVQVRSPPRRRRPGPAGRRPGPRRWPLQRRPAHDREVEQRPRHWPAPPCRCTGRRCRRPARPSPRRRVRAAQHGAGVAGSRMSARQHGQPGTGRAASAGRPGSGADRDQPPAGRGLRQARPRRGSVTSDTGTRGGPGPRRPPARGAGRPRRRDEQLARRHREGQCLRTACGPSARNSPASSRPARRVSRGRPAPAACAR